MSTINIKVAPAIERTFYCKSNFYDHSIKQRKKKRKIYLKNHVKSRKGVKFALVFKHGWS